MENEVRGCMDLSDSRHLYGVAGFFMGWSPSLFLSYGWAVDSWQENLWPWKGKDGWWQQFLLNLDPFSWRDCVLSQGNGWILLLQGYGLTYNEGACLHGGIKFGRSVRGEKKIYTKPARQSIQMFTPKFNVNINIVTSESYALISVKPPLKSIYSISFSCSFFQSAFTTTMCVFE